LLIVALLISDWIDKRHERKVLDLVAQSRNQQTIIQSPSTATPAAGTGPAVSGRRMNRWLQWQNAVTVFAFGVAAIALIRMGKLESHLPLQAGRNAPVEERHQTGTEASDQSAAFRLYFTNFSAPQSQARDFDPEHVNLWGRASLEDQPIRISASEPKKPLIDWRSSPPVDWSVVNAIHQSDAVFKYTRERPLTSR